MPVPGGLERMMADLCGMLQTRGWPVSALFPAFAASERLEALFGHASVSLAFGPAELCFEYPLPLSQIIRVAKLLRDATPAGGIVHLHYPESFLSVRHLLAVRLAQRHCVVSFHGVSDWQSAGERKRRITGAGHRLCDAILTNSSAVRHAALSAGVTDQMLRTIPCAAPEPDPAYQPTRAVARARLGVASRAFVVASAGRLVDRKRIGDVICAVQRLSADKERPVCLLIAGEGPERPALEALAACGRATVQFLGYLSGASALDDLYAASDVFALPSEREAFGLVYVEAALRSLPSIALAQGGVSDVIRDGETGILLARPGDIDGLTSALDRLRRDQDLRRRLGAAACKRARELFTLPAVSDRVEAVYNGLLAAGTPGKGRA